MRGLLRGVERSSGSSGWLADPLPRRRADRRALRGEWNYEAVIKETNDELIADKTEPLYAIYPEDGVSVGDSPLGFVDRGRGKEVESFFADRGLLLKGETQARIAATGGASNSAAPRQSRPIRPPNWTRAARLRCPATRASGHSKGAVALPGRLRRRSLTALCIDVSGSIKGHGKSNCSKRCEFC